MDDNQNEGLPEGHEAHATTDSGEKKLSRPRDGRMIAGVCAGVGRHFQIDATLVRVIWVVGTCLGGAGIVAYLICWIVIPEE